jgi:hypothetical protein
MEDPIKSRSFIILNKIVVNAGGFFLSVTRAGLARVVCFKNNFS